ncbi:hypothetical protein A3I27_03750 [Candidatus Giovannonibacteria bacterium RIFCSPLOWO2_02_FULL_43_11b]|uniref:Uncharacterized protein n=1 Tax=Candidatus Giovannonibacteria bacterium RIFCSPHIGHO2_12_FULL_43_15 TaxID=1798341 RepID=A0A1F5WNU7_9BACT|nr:MAG: hypothetical protein A2739_00930 [Candidatus Giovannonibacteria bacterium RIFCSPHIGHO2_01_FULL_43_100]OGF67343.1 MAG: hypothetical protein A3B97_03435 [Candidatus Giovannonibacteria bacterium RIFCSPHIGHO2_02_FULL_43_32]OGF77333.1 MAG: hypothetical protein A3F23_03480 [Candidatus Giovannonibacteria bacterium RIFCSPHIGHO2_12_FULL_43_15]OGF78946.1 MAG: hypothetical protein A3A15_03165 [Candidatus Giovannonibacteria bacterium RIFCSPLOWO2_01_FULL_43_60]OGF89098.1 MAG: hypothetical protein A3
MNQKYILILAVIILLGVGSYYVATKKAEAPIVENQQNVPSDGTANWKTYRNEKYGFLVKYPPEFSIDNTEGPVTVVFTTRIEGTPYFIAIDVDSPVYKGLQEYRPPRKVMVDGVEAEIRFIDIQKTSNLPYLAEQMIAYFNNASGDHSYEIILTSSGNKILPELENAFNQILSTFKFIK